MHQDALIDESLTNGRFHLHGQRQREHLEGKILNLKTKHSVSGTAGCRTGPLWPDFYRCNRSKVANESVQ